MSEPDQGTVSLFCNGLSHFSNSFSNGADDSPSKA